jgi:hypothetical protein
LRFASQAPYDAGGLEFPGTPEAGVTRWVAPAAYLLGIGWYIAISILLGVFIGHWVDDVTDFKPTFTLIGILVGLLVAGFGAARMVQRFIRGLGAEDSRRD